MRLLLIVPALLAMLLSEAQAQVYKWVDKKGTVHFTDNPDELPEPQRSEALRKISEKIKKDKEKKSLPPPVLPGIPPTEKLPPDPATSGGTPAKLEPPVDRRQQKKEWQGKMQKARTKVANLEKRCKELEAQQNQSNRDKLILARPVDRQKSQQSAKALKVCRGMLKTARHHLEVDLPQQARKAKVPPGWLR